MKHALPFAAAVLVALGLGCASSELEGITFCATDEDCASDQVCFADGCGAPDKNVVVEITASAVDGHLAQDFALDRVERELNFSSPEPAAIQGVVQVRSPGGSSVTGYTHEVTFRATGESLIIPGRTRALSYKMQPENGVFQFPVPTGRYSLSVTPSAEGLYPPWFTTGIQVAAGQAAEVEVTWPSFDNLVRFDGRLLQTAQPPVPVQGAAMEVQAVDPTSGRALSQRVPVSSGHAGATGDFFLYMDPPAGLQWIQIRATPKDAKAMVPSREFLVPLDAMSTEPLELGDFGAAVTVRGRALSSAGTPLERAQVFIDGEVGGGGRFRSEVVETDAQGNFTLKTLPSAAGGNLELWVAPRSQSPSGLLRAPLEVSAVGGPLGDFTAPDKLTVMGTLTRPDGQPASSVTISAVPVSSTEGAPLPNEQTQGATDAQGRFTLLLDPATYRVDFLPSDNQPRVSRLVTVRRTLDAQGTPVLVTSLPPFTLSRGRTVSGKVSAVPRRLSTGPAEPAPYASVKFFRVVTFDGERSSVLLAETTADATGRYTVILPTR